MTQPASVGPLSKFAAGLANPPVNAYEYKGAFGIGKHNTVLDTAGIRGTFSHPQERTRAGTYTVGGTVTIEPGAVDLDFWLPLILGGTKSANIIPVVDTALPSFYVAIDRVAQQYLYSGCYVNKATFKAAQGSLLDLTLDIQGQTETPGTVSGLSGLTPALTAPYFFADATLTNGGTSYQFREFELVIDNHLKLDRFMNSVTRTDLPRLDRTIGISLKHPFTSDTISLYDNNQTTNHVVITLANGVFQLVFDMIACQFPTAPPETPGREEILLPLGGVARKSGSTLELVTTNKSS